ncbi:luciferase family protein [Streptomyces sp. NPDC018693]|uniref:luciferase domain-containing protein n=1 Tax=unclassified Streptomyces TaxID=2593676 RepID=UPI0037A19978
MTFARRALEQLESWPDLTAGPASCGIGRALHSRQTEIVHFHSDHDVDVHLTARVIQRFSADLEESTAIRLVPGSRWVTVRLECDADLDLLLSLVSIALQAHQAWPPGASTPPTECNFQRVMLLPRNDGRD